MVGAARQSNPRLRGTSGARRAAQPREHAALSDSALGQLIRARREELDLRLVDLAKATGLSMSFLSQLERGLTNPSLNSLVAIAEALNTSSHALLSAVDHAADEIDSTPPGGGSIAPFDGGFARALLHGPRPLQPLEITGGYLEYPEHFSYHSCPELVYVCDGHFVWELENHGTHELHPGSTLYFGANVGHRWRIVDPAIKNRILLIVVGDAESVHPGFHQ